MVQVASNRTPAKPVVEVWQSGRLTYLICDRAADCLTVLGILVGLPWDGVQSGSRNGQLLAVCSFALLVAVTRRWVTRRLPYLTIQEWATAGRECVTFQHFLHGAAEIRANGPFLSCVVRYWAGLLVTSIFVGLGAYVIHPAKGRLAIEINLVFAVVLQPAAALCRCLSLIRNIRIVNNDVEVSYYCGAKFNTIPEMIEVILPSPWASGTELLFRGGWVEAIKPVASRRPDVGGEA